MVTAAQTGGPPRTVEVRRDHTLAEVDRETAQMLGSSGLEKFRLPPLTAGRLALLDLIGSPIVQDVGTPSRMDVIRSLYVVAVGPAAVTPIARALRHAEALERAKEQAAQSVEMFAEWLASLEWASEGWVQFDVQALEWLDGTGLRDVTAAFGELARAFEDAGRGLSIIPKGEKPADPFAGGTGPSGSETSGVSSPAPAAP